MMHVKRAVPVIVRRLPAVTLRMFRSRFLHNKFLKHSIIANFGSMDGIGSVTTQRCPGKSAEISWTDNEIGPTLCEAIPPSRVEEHIDCLARPCSLPDSSYVELVDPQVLDSAAPLPDWMILNH